MSELYRALLRAERERGLAEKNTLRGRMRSLMSKARTTLPRPRPDPAWLTSQPRAAAPERPRTSRVAEPSTPRIDPTTKELATLNATTRKLHDEIASTRDAVAALDERLAGEVAERDAKLREELQRAMRGLETELSNRFVMVSEDLRRTIRLVVVGVAVFVLALAAGVLVAIAAL